MSVPSLGGNTSAERSVILMRRPTGRFGGHVVPRGTLEIGIYEPPAPLDSAVTDLAAGLQRFPPTAGHPVGRLVSRYGVVGTGALASLLLHALFITTLGWGGYQAQVSTPRPPDLSAPGARAEQYDELTMELVPVEEAHSSSVRDEEALSNPTLAAVTLEAALADPSVPPAWDPGEEQTDLSKAALVDRSSLVGRYLGQINARIERAWRRPRTRLDEGLFLCRVRIEQDASGGVKEITLEHCNGDARWQLSLVHAIQLASPLPAPPDPSVFTHVLRMGFRAEPYSAGALPDAYEPIRQ